MKRDKRDIIFSKCIRMRVDWVCEKCGKYYPEGRRQGLDCSHFYGRRHRSTRWHPDNAFAHCRGCHQYLGSNPAIFDKFARDSLGNTRYEMLRERHNEIAKYTKADLEAIHKHYKSEFERMKALRMDGEQGYIRLVSYD